MQKKQCISVIAEAGVNHNGDLGMARELIDVAVEAGADAVKFQTFKAEKLVNSNAPKADYQKSTSNRQESQLEMLKRLELSEEAHQALIEYCRQRGIEFLSTPFDLDSLHFLVSELDIPRIKISSGDITNAPLLLKAAQARKPIILSTGMSTLGEIERALGVLAFGYIHSESHRKPSLAAFEQALFSEAGYTALLKNVVLLHCTTEYPAPFNEVNLRVIETLRKAFGLPVGLSDHTPGIAIPIAAVALGAVIIEKHFTLDRNLPGPDHKASLEPGELISMIRSIRQVKEALGTEIKGPTSSEIKNRAVARKCLVAARRIMKGEPFTPENLTVKRAGEGVSPINYWNCLGMIAERNYEEDEKVKL
ncbi:N-acetylneuraminate synthase [Paradesulfitobacterium ferrireducens]|uniref:N-acetylneuraminate synthase n=1 Tax=Paradesulfitobacterium ferrireducens TaxID=2816476 RepID=UPI001A8C29C1|nr:N-acetylneuraminate synthase [Paradesulfitobacterium ferrireducens]